MFLDKEYYKTVIKTQSDPDILKSELSDLLNEAEEEINRLQEIVDENTPPVYGLTEYENKLKEKYKKEERK